MSFGYEGAEVAAAGGKESGLGRRGMDGRRRGEQQGDGKAMKKEEVREVIVKSVHRHKHDHGLNHPVPGAGICDCTNSGNVFSGDAF